MLSTNQSLSLVASGLAALCVAGCATGPDYVRPETSMPAAWHASLEGGAMAEAVPAAAWWHTLDDPTLTELIDRALADNLDVKIAEARVREARAARGLVVADRLPSLGTSGNYRYAQTPEPDSSGGGAWPLSAGVSAGPAGLSRTITYRGRNLTVTRNVSGAGATTGVILTPSAGSTFDRRQDMFSFGFDASWELDVFGGVSRAVEAADASVEAAGERLSAVYVTLAAEVGLSYIDLRTAQARLDIAHRNHEAQSQTLILTRARFEAGLNSEFDAVRAEAQLAETASQIPLLETDVAMASHRLAVLVGAPPGDLAALLEPAAPLPAPPSQVPVGLPGGLLQRRPDIRAAERDLAAATARIGVAVAEQFPKFTLTGSLGTQASGLGMGMLDRANQVWSIGPGISWPLFQGGRIRANIDVQNERQMQTLYTYEQTILLALEEVENGLVGYAKEQERRVALSDAVAANRRAVQLANERYTIGLEDFLSVLTAQAQVFQSEDRLLLSQSRELLDLIALYKALGGGWETGEQAPQPPPVP